MEKAVICFLGGKCLQHYQVLIFLISKELLQMNKKKTKPTEKMDKGT